MGKKTKTGTKTKKLGVKRETIKKLTTVATKDLGGVAGGAATVSRTCWNGP